MGIFLIMCGGIALVIIMKKSRKHKQAGSCAKHAESSKSNEVIYEEVKDEQSSFSHFPMTENASYAQAIRPHASKAVLQERNPSFLTHIAMSENKCYGQASQQEPVYAEVEDKVDMTKNDAYQERKAPRN